MNNNNNNEAALLNLAGTNTCATAFVDHFYTIFDTDRTSLAACCFTKDTQFFWDGVNLPGLDTLPLTKHIRLSIDAHPVVLTTDPEYNKSLVTLPSNTIIVNTRGDVRYGQGNAKRGFFHTFVLQRQNNTAEYRCTVFTARLATETLAINVQPPPRQNNNHFNNNKRR